MLSVMVLGSWSAPEWAARGREQGDVQGLLFGSKAIPYSPRARGICVCKLSQRACPRYTLHCNSPLASYCW